MKGGESTEPAVWRNAKPLLAFASVGVAATACYFLALHLFEKVIGLGYRIAATGAYIASTGAHFFLNRHFTFKAAASPVQPQLMRYAVLIAMNYAINITTVVACVELLNWTTVQGVALSMVFSLAAGYTLAQAWIFRPPAGKT